MDIKIKTDDLKFKFRVSAVFIHDGKLLVDKYRTEESYCLPGGYVNLGETSSEGMIREIKEETNLDFKVVKFMGIIENFFTNFDKETAKLFWDEFHKQFNMGKYDKKQKQKNKAK